MLSRLPLPEPLDETVTTPLKVIPLVERPTKGIFTEPEKLLEARKDRLSMRGELLPL